jgi:prepilin-type N-terminal cleavage/methylation domain-containing protein
MHTNKKGFTLVELIVVITILAILWTIAFLSFQWYSKSSRDSVRIQDLASTRKVLELFSLEKWFYPLPTNITEIVYSWAVVWHQWVLWDRVIENIGKINKKPVDPLYETEYAYSVTDIKNEYELWWVLEWWWTAYNPILNTTNAAATDLSALVSWDYNGKVLKVSTWWLDYVLAIPTILSTDTSETDISKLISDKKLVYNNEANLPSNYKWVVPIFTSTWWFDYTPWGDIVIFSGSINDLATSTWKIAFSKKLQKAYSGTILAAKSDFKELLAFNAESNTWTAETFAWDIITTTPQFPKDLGKVTTTTTTSTSNSGWGWGLSGPYASCTSAWLKLSATTTYTSCDTVDIIICSWVWSWYTLAACNVWSMIAWTASGSQWDFIQFWKSNNTNTNADNSGDWKSPGGTDAWSANDWGVTESLKATATYSNSSSPNQAKMQWPCVSGYHIPTQLEWAQLVSAWWWGSNGTNLMNDLKIYAWWGLQTTSGGFAFTSYSVYWSSSPSTSLGHNLLINSSSIAANDASNRNAGAHIRCFKN